MLGLPRKQALFTDEEKRDHIAALRLWVEVRNSINVDNDFDYVGSATKLLWSRHGQVRRFAEIDVMIVQIHTKCTGMTVTEVMAAIQEADK